MIDPLRFVSGFVATASLQPKLFGPRARRRLTRAVLLARHLHRVGRRSAATYPC
jgi:hypothetical protein